MSEVTRRADALASCILAHETAAHGAAAQQDQALRVAVQKLRARLEPVISTAGFDALLGRAVWLAAREHAAAYTRPRAPQGDGPDRLAMADSAVLGHFLHLLAGFLGEHLTVRLLEEQWHCVSGAADAPSRQVHS